MTLKDMIAADINGVFLASSDEFGEFHDIGISSFQKYHVIASLQSDVINNGSFDGRAPLQMASDTLLVAYPIGGELEVNVGQMLFVDDVTFEVVDVLNEMGLATILLKRGKDRRKRIVG